MAAVLATDANLEIGPRLAAFRHRQLHEFAHAFLVEYLEGVVFQDAHRVVVRQELVLGVFTAEREGRLRQVVGAEAEELGILCHATGAQAGAYHLEHAAELDADIDAVGQLDHLMDALDIAVDAQHLFHRRHLRHHDLGIDLDAFLGAQRGGFEDRLDLHRIQLGIGDAQTHAAMAEHRVDLGERAYLLERLLLLLDSVFFKVAVTELGHAAAKLGEAIGILHVQLRVEQLERLGQFFECLQRIAQVVQVGDFQFELGGRWQEFVQRRVHQAHGDGQALHGLEDALEVGALDRQQAVDGGLALFECFGEDHLLHDGQAVGGVEHALGAAQADAHGAELAGARGIFRRVGVGHHLEARDLVGPFQKRHHVLVELGLHGRHFAGIDMAFAAVDGDDIAFMQEGVADAGAAIDIVDVDRIAAGHAGLAHAARDHRRVRGLAAARGEDALRLEEAVNILGLGFLAHEDDLLAGIATLFSGVGVEDDPAGGGTGRGGQAGGERFALEVRRKLRHQQLFEQGRIDA